MSQIPRCPRCGATVVVDPSKGLCPACLLRAALEIDLTELPGQPMRSVGGYEIIEEIARGGMGVVYRARHGKLRREVALKLITSGAFASNEALRRFQSEAEVAASLKHPNIVPIFEIGEEDGHPFFSMGLVEGPPMDQKLARKPLEPKAAANLLIKIARAVQNAHDRGILHRDLKPANILIDAHGEPHLTDFGVAKVMQKESTLTYTNAILGTPSYMAPEQARGDVKNLAVTADVYGLGAVLYHALTGEPPFAGGTTYETVRQVLESDPRQPSMLNRAVDKDLETICLKCLEKEAVRRYPAASALADDLERWLRHEPILARPINLVERSTKLVRRRPMLVSLGAALFIALAAGLIGIVAEWRRADQQSRIASQQRELALRQKAIAEEQLYAADINLAQQAFNDNDDGHALRLLASHIPKAGERDLRGFEWRYLSKEAQGNATRKWNLPGQWVRQIAFARDRPLLASVTQNGLCEVRQLPEGRTIFSPANLHNLCGVALSADGKRLALCSEDDSVQVWSVPEQRRLWKKQWSSPFLVQFALDDQALAVAYGVKLSDNDGGDAAVLSAATGELLRPLSGGGGRALAVSDDGLRIATGSSTNHLAAIWDARSGRQLAVLSNALYIASLAWNPDGQTVASGSWADAVQLWNTTTGEQINAVKVPGSMVWALAFDRSGSHLITGGGDHTCRSWDWRNWKEIDRFSGHVNGLTSVALAHDGSALATSSGEDIRFWDLTSAREPEPIIPTESHRNFPLALYSSHLNQIATPSTNGVGFYDAKTFGLKKFIPKPAIPIQFVDHSPELLVVALTSEGQQLRAWNCDTGEDRRIRLQDVPSPPRRIVASRDGRKALLGFPNGQMGVWNLQSGARETLIQAATKGVWTLAISPDERFCASGSEDNTAGLWTFPALTNLAVCQASAPVECVDFSPDSSEFAAGSWDHIVYRWRVPSGQLIEKLTEHKGSIYSISYCRGGASLFVGQLKGSCILWDLRTHRELMRLPGALAAFVSDDLGVVLSDDQTTLKLLQAPVLGDIHP